MDKTNPTPDKEICECGHDKLAHFSGQQKNRHHNWEKIGCIADNCKCPCKKFKPQSQERIKVQGSPKVVPDTLRSNDFVLSEKIYDFKLSTKDVREFIKRLKEDLLFMRKGSYNYLECMRLIDALAGEELTK